MLYIILCEYYNNTWLYTIATPTLKSHWSKILLHKSLTLRISLTCSDVWMLNTGAFIHQAWHSSLQWQNASFRRNNASLLSCSNKDYSCSLSSGLFAHTFDVFVWSKALCRPPCLLSAERWPHCQPLSTPAITRPEKTELLASGRSSRANRTTAPERDSTGAENLSKAQTSTQRSEEVNRSCFSRQNSHTNKQSSVTRCWFSTKNVFIFFLWKARQNSTFWLFNSCNGEKIGKIHERKKNIFGLQPSAQCYIFFGFSQEFSFRCIPNVMCFRWHFT